jgi:predicted site-specific integrase-resolvase
MNQTFVSGKKASEILGVHQRTLYQWEEKGKIEVIRTPGNQRMYNVNKFLNYYNNETIDDTDNTKLNIIYVRVSSHSQKDDLQRQKNYMVKRFPKHMVIEDIGSGINLNRKGLRKIIKYAIEGKIEEVVVAYKDRLARFGFELIEDLIKVYSNGKIIIVNKNKDLEPEQEQEQELIKDVLQIMNIFVAKMNGLRKYKDEETDIKDENNDYSDED